MIGFLVFVVCVGMVLWALFWPVKAGPWHDL